MIFVLSCKSLNVIIEKWDENGLIRAKELIFITISLACYLIFAMYRLCFGVVIPAIEEAFQVDKAAAGALFSATSLATATGAAIAGAFMARMGMKRTYLLGLIILCFGMAVAPTSFNFAVLSFYLVIASFGAGLFLPTLYTILGEYKAKSRAMILGIANSTFSLGGFIGPWLAAQLIIIYGWSSPFLAFSLIGFLLVPIFWLFAHPLRNEMSEGSRISKGYSQVLRKGNVIKLLASITISNFAFFSIIAWTPTFLIEFQGFDFYIASIVFSLFSLSGIFGSIILGKISDKLSNRNRLAFITAFISGLISIFLYTMRSDYTFIIAAMVLFGFTFYPFWNLQMAIAQESVERKYVGIVTGIMYTASLTGSIISPALVGVLIETIGIVPSMLYGASIPTILYSFIVLTCKDSRDVSNKDHN